MSGELSIENVSVSIGPNTLVRNVSLHVAPGEVVALVGPNGAGKTTLLRTLYRAQRPTTGRVLLDGDDVWRMPAKKAAQRLAAVLQDATGDFELTVFDVVAMGRTPHKRAFEGDTDADRAIIARRTVGVGHRRSDECPVQPVVGRSEATRPDCARVDAMRRHDRAR